MVDVTYTVSANNDNGHEVYNERGVSSPNYLAVAQGADWIGCDGFVRFQDVLVPQASIIDSATLSVYSFNAAWDDLYADIFGNDVDDANDLVVEADVDDRTRTAASVNEAHDDCVGTWIDSDVTAIVQEIVNRALWASGNNMAFMYITARVGAKHCELRAFSSGVNLPHIHISYHAGAGGPTVKKGSNLSNTMTTMLNSKMLFSACNRFPKLNPRHF